MSTQRVPLSQLLPPTSNPRRRIDPAGIEGLAASIRTDGVLQNLVVTCLKGDRFRVVTGERRYRAMKLLESRGEVGADYPVPVEVRHGLKPAEARRIALVENVQREALDAIDEADGFAALLQKGATLDDVAAQTGLSTTTVKRRLALAGLCDEAKRAVRDGAIGLGIAEALTLGTHERQRRILADIADGGWYDSDDVRARLIEEKPSVAMALFPLERYGGTFTSDLFAEAEATWFDDAGQFHALQRQAVEQMAAERARTAAFVDVFDTHGAPWWHYRAAQEGESGGVVVNLTPAGRVEVRDGLARHEVPHAVAAETRESPLAARQERPEYPSWLVRHMAAHKMLTVQTLLIAARRTAKRVAVVLLMRGTDGHHGRVTVEAHPALALFAGGDDRPRSHDAIEAAAYFERLLGLAPDEDEPVGGPGSRGAWERLVGEPKDGADLYERVKRLKAWFGGLDKMYRLHKWLGIAALTVAIVHWLWAQGPKWAVGWGWLDRPQRGPRAVLENPVEQLFATLRGTAEGIGEWAFYAAALLIALALLRRFPYRLFYKTHRLLAAVYLVLAFHAVVLTSFTYWTAPVGMVMALLLAGGSWAAVVVLLRRVAAGRRVGGTIRSLHYYPGVRVLEVGIEVPQGWPGHKAGQFAFVTSDAAEGAHPYTVASAWNDADRRITFVIKELGDHTRRLREKLRVGQAVTVEGPYGCFTFDDTGPQQIWVGGGIGVTPFIARMKDLAARPDAAAPAVDFFHTTSDYDAEAIARLTADAAAAGIRLHVLVDARDGRLDGDRIRAAVPGWRGASLWFCGPAGFGEALRRDFAAHGLPVTSRFHQELFAMR